MKRRTRLWAKLKSRSGESLGEVLVSVLISAMALVMLASMITTSAKLITGSKERLSDYYADQQHLTFSGAPDDAAHFSATIREDGSPADGVSETVRIDLYTEDSPNSGKLYAYRTHSEGGDTP